MEKIEHGYDQINLPKDLENIVNKDDFLTMYEKISSWYGNDFSDSEIALIKGAWEKGYTEYGNPLNKVQKAIIGNRIDTGLFEYKYTHFITLDKTIRTISDANKQRKFREIAIKLDQKFGNLHSSDIKIIENKFLEAKKINQIPDFDTIVQEINKNKSNNEFVDGQQTQNPHYGPSEKEVQEMKNLEISPQFQGLKNIVFDLLDLDSGQKRDLAEGFFNEVAINLANFSEIFGGIPDNFFTNKEIVSQILYSCYNVANDGDYKLEYDILIGELKENLISDGDTLHRYVDYISQNISSAELSLIKDIELSQEDKKNIDFLVEEKGLARENAEKVVKEHKFLQEKIANKQELTAEQKKILPYLEELFGQKGQITKLRKIHEMKKSEIGRKFVDQKIGNRNNIEYATGNMKDIKPWAIVENNKSISKYIYGDPKVNGANEKEYDGNLSSQDRSLLFQKLVEIKRGDQDFQESIKYLDKNGNIDKDKVANDGIDIASIESNKKIIDEMIYELAVNEFDTKNQTEKIKGISIKKSAMICCFRAISKYFDKANTKGENFASEFEIKDVNENIEFDEKTGIIKMTGTIGANKNHIGLYYNTQTGELSFDNFLAYDPQVGYKIGQGSGAREKINVKLPTMNEMEKQAKSVNFDLIEKLSINTKDYIRKLGFAMGERIRLNCFQGFIGVDMEVNKQFVQQFNEKNILKQDIIKSIYSKFYNKTDIDEKLKGSLIINEGNEPEQFKLIKLISDTIDNCNNANELLRFRNAINKFDEILDTKQDMVKKDDLLKFLFADNVSDISDVNDTSKDIMKKENEDLTLSGENNTLTYKSEIKNNGDSPLNYFIFLDLLSENKGSQRLINLDEFENSLKNIEMNHLNLLDNSSILFGQNYEKYVNENILPNFREQELADIEQKLDEAYGANTIELSQA